MMFRKPDHPAADVDDDDDGVYLTLAEPEPAPISLVTIAAELEEHPGALVHRLGGEVLIEPATGLRCVTVETCRRLLDERRELNEEMARRTAEKPPAQPPPRWVADEVLEGSPAAASKTVRDEGRRDPCRPQG